VNRGEGVRVSDRTATGSLAKLLEWRLAEDPDRGFVFVEDDGPWTYRQLAGAAEGLRRQLADVGVSAGDRVIVRVGNDERYLAAASAIWCLEGAVVAMHPAAPASEVLRVADALNARTLVCDPADPAADSKGLSVVPLPHVTAAHSDLAGTYASPRRDTSSEPALILLTSGTTGAPKGVVLTHGNAWANLTATVSAFRRDTAPTALADQSKPPNLIANPLSHTAGVVRLLFALYVGRRIVVIRKFDGPLTKRLLERHHIDNLTINPAMIRILLETLQPDDDLGSVRYVSSGTAPLTSTLREQFEARFHVPILQAYGQTEAFGGIAIESARDVLAGKRRPGSVGRPLPGVELRIVDPVGADSDEGEIVVRSRSATTGYMGDAGAGPIDGDGWLHTGDIGRLDEDGYLYITGRLKNIIICGGFNVVPEELEAALDAIPGVRESVIIGVPNERLGEVPVAVVEASCSSDDVVRAARSMLAPYKLPRQVIVVDRLPRVPNGKVDRPAVVALAASSQVPKTPMGLVGHEDNTELSGDL
jgi:long-chain acyl-CoA synthetase